MIAITGLLGGQAMSSAFRGAVWVCGLVVILAGFVIDQLGSPLWATVAMLAGGVWLIGVAFSSPARRKAEKGTPDESA